MDYYEILKVPNDATTAEIKSAYRKLARKKHPDLNEGSKVHSREFARIAKAYKVLSNPQERAFYDRQRLKAKFSKKGSVINNENPHASRARQMVYERRYNAIIDRMIAEERQESMALQEIIFPVVALFFSTGFVAVFKPLFWSNSGVFGKIILLMLFIIGVLHLLKRLHAGFERYTYSSVNIYDTLLAEIEEETRPYSRIQAIMFLIIGIFVSLGIGLLIGNFFGVMTTAMMPKMFASTLRLEFIFYPPIVVLIVDIMHSFITRNDY
ncbi:MAG: J domain-containing protein [Acidobacteriota bacterium]|nr:J domain-containing protein [Acidobacteriota bacterium]